MADEVASAGTPPRETPGRETGTSRGLIRVRLTARFLDPSTYRVGSVVAPAGSGKSRLLSHVAASYPGPVGWAPTPDPVPRTEAALVSWLASGLAAAGRPVDTGGTAPATVDGLLARLAADPPVLVVLDDVHLMEGSEAESALASLVQRAPSALRLLLASRVALPFDLSRLRVSGQLVDVGPDDLRFRTWEVEELFRDVYGEPLLPEEVAALTRRTAGWAAYLQLFFLATSHRPLAERRLVLGTLQHRTRLVSEYLARHVLAGLDPALQDFLVRTSVLRRPSGRLCDEFLGWESGSADRLAELERRRLFTERLADDSYRYHAVLLSYLDAKLVETVGLDVARAEHRRAGALLEREGWADDALAAYARAEDWESMARVLGRASSGDAPFDEAWVEALPANLVVSDALLLLARARSVLARGSLEEAVAVLRRAEEVAASEAVLERCRAERERILVWAEPDRPARRDWPGLIRAATQRQPEEARRMAAAMSGVGARFAEGCAAMLAGDLAAAARIMRAVAASPDADGTVAAGASVLGLVAGAAVGRPVMREGTARIRDEVEASGTRWLERMVRAALLPAGPSGDETLDDLIGACDRAGDRWGAAVITAVGGFRLMHRRARDAHVALERAAGHFRDLGAGVIESSLYAYAGLAALVTGQDEEALRLAARARSHASMLDVPGASAVSSLVFAAVRRAAVGAGPRRTLESYGTWSWHASVLEERIPAVGDDAVEPGQVPEADAGRAGGAPMRIRCLGGFAVEAEGRPLDDSSVKPMERALLHLLASRTGEPVHREELIAALWPDAGSEAGLHRLQVAVSSLRRLLGGAGLDGAQLIARAGDAYVLSPPSGSAVDVNDFVSAVTAADAARAAGDGEAERKRLVDSVALYGGALLPGDGPADWVVERRRRLSALYTGAAARLAALCLDDDPAQACRVARAGLDVDRYRDDLWKLLIDGAERAGNHAESEQARRDYEAVLQELGV